jgi:pimeloyl-ACP methyl ester carboxylesterase
LTRIQRKFLQLKCLLRDCLLPDCLLPEICRAFPVLLAALFCLPWQTVAAAEGEAPVEPPTLSIEELRARYEGPESKYLQIGDVSLHYQDEGSGPAVLLLHASYHSLRTWDQLAERLIEDGYRVVRFDFPTAGLSNDETPAPPEGFSMMGRYVESVEQIVSHLQLDRFTLIGTSSGGATAFRYASTYPEQIERFVLINTAGMPRIPRTDPLRERASTARWAGMKIRPREFWEVGLSQNFFGAPIPEWMVDQSYDFARLEGRADKAAEYKYATGDPRAILSRISAPTLILWGKSNPTVMHLEADVIQHWMTGAFSTIVKYDGLGHYPYVEDIDAVYPDVAAFLSGELDTRLRRTTLMPLGEDCDCP